MWIPKTEQEIVDAVTSGSLEESVIFDAKKEISSRNQEIAKDVAAMANDGGVLIYGIDEDTQGRPTVLHPIPLAGQPERITSIVQTSIAEPPRIVISTIPTAADPTRGYIVVVVPASERAPHMVVVKGDNRYYGRTATGNTPLSEAEVARLYERRQHWQVDREVLLTEEVERSPFPPHDGIAYLHLFARPVQHEEKFLERVIEPGQAVQGTLNNLVTQVAQPCLFPQSYAPDFRSPEQWLHRAEGFLCKLWEPNRSDDPSAALYLQIDFDGSGHLFCGRAAERLEEKFLFFPKLVAGNTTRFLALMGSLYFRADYVGMVDIGVAITGIKGSIPHTDNYRLRWSLSPYDQNEYRRTDRISALALNTEVYDIARKMLMPIFNAMSQARIDPFPIKPVSK